jgi:plasmid stabilization system protein ParE
MNAVVDDQASDDLDEIYAWIAKDRPEAADSVNDRILAAIESLARLPQMGHAGRVPGTYEWVVHGLPYIIVFRSAQEKRRP